MQLRINALLISVLIMGMFTSCVKETNDKLDQNNKFVFYKPQNTASVKFIHAYTPLTLNSLSTSTTGFRITMDGIKLNGATNISSSTNTLQYGGTFPSTTAYSFLPPGTHNFKFTLNRITSGNFAPIAGDDVFNATLTLAAGKLYSLFIADPYASPNV